MFKIICLSVFAVSCSLSASENLIKNPGFERGLSDWKISGRADADVAVVKGEGGDGGACLKISNRSPLSPNVYKRIYQTVSVRPNTRYKFGVKLKSVRGSGFFFGGGKEWRIRTYAPNGSYGWKTLSKVYTTGPNEKSFTFHLITENLTDAVFVDDVFFEDMDQRDSENSLRVETIPISALGDYDFYPAEKTDAIEIDGDLSEWNAKTFVTIPTRDSRDLSTRTALRYDDDNLYVAVVVGDDKRNAFKGPRMWLGDSVQFAFAKGGAYGPEYGVSVVDGKPALWCWKDGTRVLKNDSLNVKSSVEGTTVSLEIALPWKAIFADGKPARSFKFCLLTNDNDGRGRKGWINWTPGIAKGKDPFKFVLVALTENDVAVGVKSERSSYPLDGLGEFTAYAANPTANAEKVKFSVPSIGYVGDLRLPPLSVAVAKYARPMRKSGTAVERVDLSGKSAECRVKVSSFSKAALEKRVRDMVARSELLKKLLTKCHALGVPVDYQMIDVATVVRFIAYIREDIRRKYYKRADWALSELNRIAKTAEKRLRKIIAGKIVPPKNIPWYVTSKVETQGLMCDAETVTFADKTPKRRPIFFVGYGHFAQAKRDIPNFKKFGANVIQFEIGPRSTILPPRNSGEKFHIDDKACRGVVKLLEKAAASDVAVVLLLSPHYFPTWAKKKYPELNNYKGGFLSYAIDHPIARMIIKAYLETIIPMIKDCPALHSVCLSNEPVYLDSSKDKYTQKLWHAYLKRVHGDIATLNFLYKTEYKSFETVPIPGLANSAGSPIFYDWCMFNDERFADWHKWMADIVHSIAPELPCHAKAMARVFDSEDGVSAERFAAFSDYNGCDASSYYKYNTDEPNLNKMMWYDILTSMKRQPIVNSEDHVIPDRDSRYISQQAAHIRSDLWMGAACGRAVSVLWVWERVYDRYHDLSDSILNRPDCVDAIGRAALDLNRHTAELAAIQNFPRKIAIVYSDTAAVYDKEEYSKSMRAAYGRLVYSGVAPAFVTENQIADGALSKYNAVILPSTDHLRGDAAARLAKFAERAKLISLNGKMPQFDQYARKLKPFSAKFAATLDGVANPAGISTNLTCSDKVWWRVGDMNGTIVILAVNLGDERVNAAFSRNGVVKTTNLNPLEPLLLKLEK